MAGWRKNACRGLAIDFTRGYWNHKTPLEQISPQTIGRNDVSIGGEKKGWRQYVSGTGGVIVLRAV